MTFLSACDMALTRTGKTHRGQKLVFSPTRDTFRCAGSWVLGAGSFSRSLQGETEAGKDVATV